MTNKILEARKILTTLDPVVKDDQTHIKHLTKIYRPEWIGFCLSVSELPF